MITIGIDIGFTGAISYFIDEEPFEVFDMPVLKVGSKRELDDLKLKEILFGIQEEKCMAYVEKQQSMPGDGIASTARFMTGYGQVLGVLTGLGIPKTLVHPRSWKSKMMKDMGKEKEASILRCKQLYPEFAQKYLTLKKHHGRADAILIAAYGVKYGG